MPISNRSPTPDSAVDTIVPVPSRRIRILFLIDGLGQGGTEKQLILLAKNLPREYFDPVIGVLQPSSYQRQLCIDVPIVEFPTTGPWPISTIVRLCRIQRYLRKRQFDVVQTQLPGASIYGALAVQLLTVKPRLVGTRRNLYHWIHEEPWHYRAQRFTARWCDKILVNSRTVARACREREGIPDSKIVFIPNGVDINKYIAANTDTIKKKIGLCGKYPVVGVVANWRPIKGLAIFLRAATEVLAQCPSAYFVLVGREMGQKHELSSLAHQLGIKERIIFLEDYPDARDLMTMFDVAVQPSLSESFSNVLIEYMAAGRPIVATQVGDAEHTIEHGIEGLLVAPNDSQQLSAAILDLCQHRGDAVKLGEAARRKVKANWALPDVLQAYQRFYRQLIACR